MKAIKANKEYTVTEENKDFYVKQGFDIVDEEGKILEYGKGKKVDYSKYQNLLSVHEDLVKENETLHARIKELESMLTDESSAPKKLAQKKSGE